MSDPIGNWENLPHDPLAFFGLDEDFDRRQLKRAYGKLIRQYKPETHPNEFQKIRAAYEQLESANRYGRTQRATESANAAWEKTRAKQPVERSGRRRENEKRSATPERTIDQSSVSDAALQDPRETYEKLKGKLRRSPQDYYVLAILSDLAQGEDDQRSFLQCLLLGLKDHPRDAGLIALISSHLHFDIESSDAADALKATAAATRSPIFYRLTESLWERLLREQGFDIFQKVLGECEKQIRQSDPRARWAFYLRILKTAIWVAPFQWSDSGISRLESESANFDPSMEQDLEFLSLLSSYLKTRSRKSEHSATEQRLDQILKAYCTGDGPDATDSVIHLFSEIARDSHGMRLAFPSHTSDANSDLFTLLIMISNDLMDTAGISFPQINEGRNNQQASVALSDLISSAHDLSYQLDQIHRKHNKGPLFVVASSIVSFLLLSIPFALGLPKWAFVAGVVLCITASIFVYIYYVHPTFFADQRQQAKLQAVVNMYESRWRERVFRYVQSCGEPAKESLGRLTNRISNETEAKWMHVILSYCQDDRALLIFARAQKFVL